MTHETAATLKLKVIFKQFLQMYIMQEKTWHLCDIMDMDFKYELVEVFWTLCPLPPYR